MECFDDEYTNYWETNMFLQTQELDSYFDEAISAYYDSSSPDGMQSSMASKNIVSERNRRKKLNERLYALRSVVPNITKMDKASIIKDAIGYIQSLNDEVGRIQSQISELESNGGMSSSNNANFGHFDQEATTTYCSKLKRSTSFISSPIEVLEVSQ
ncbi:hypothetical protein BUALT_Bualt11G0081700 [Buddleja alternifolia]|uniref:BHLH domain-containing protein n=1 Tax=Buddleja alternifolia TaxID=168488 RepID=A0AAV6X0J5_9LAMI|nr:hypothetical protein BUALT_Bualt11G0081700 [Buddleja alternifolia]